MTTKHFHVLTLLKPLEDHLSNSNATYETLLIKKTIISQNENLQHVDWLEAKKWEKHLSKKWWKLSRLLRTLWIFPEKLTVSEKSFVVRKIITYWLHNLTCVVPRVRGLHYTIVTSTSTFGMDCPTPCISILNQRCIQTFNC